LAHHQGRKRGADWQSALPLVLVAVDIETGEEVIIREGSVVEGLLATSAVPVIFPPARWQGRLLVDGGVLNLVPFDVARQMGADRVIAVYARHDLSGKIGAAETPPGGRSAEAAIRVLLHRTRWVPLAEVAERSDSIMSRKLVEQRIRQSPPDLMIEIMMKGVVVGTERNNLLIS